VEGSQCMYCRADALSVAMRMGEHSAIEAVAFSLPQKWAPSFLAAFKCGRGSTFEAEFSVVDSGIRLSPPNVPETKGSVCMQGQ